MPNIKNNANAVTPSHARPYRSHKIPACDFCRRRKSRCSQDLVDQPCLLCRMHGATCSRASTGINERSNSELSTPTLKRRHISKSKRPRNSDRHQLRSPPAPAQCQPSHHSSDVDHHRSIETGPVPVPIAPNDTTRLSSHIVGPAMARDAQVLERYMSPAYNSLVSYARPNPYSVYSHDPRNPVVYVKVPRQRNVVPSGNGTAGFRQFEAMEKIIEPLGPELCRVYFDNVHPAFPILDEKTVLEAYPQDGLPHTLVCEIYAVSLLLWKKSKKIAATGRPVPDIRYMWNLAVSAMNDDFLAPDFSTVLACILDLFGRPITTITYNAVNVGRVVALSQSLGLNRNPLSWDLDHRQKGLRIRTWWGILIHDQWSSLSHGTPPHIHRSQWDVPLPDSDTLLISPTMTSDVVSNIQIQGGRSFMALCELTVILEDILPLIYTLQAQAPGQAFRALRRHETTLDEWEDGLPLWLRPTSLSFQRKAAGALNLQLCYLVVRMSLWRIGLLELHRSDQSDIREDKLYYQSRCRKAARAVIEFVVNLKKDELDVFWLPYTAYHFTSAATLILRCALEAENAETAQECVASAKELIDFLRTMKNEANWDLADSCLGHCEAVVEKLGDSQNLDIWRSHPYGGQAQHHPIREGDGSRGNFPTRPHSPNPVSQGMADTLPRVSQGPLNLEQPVAEGNREGGGGTAVISGPGAGGLIATSYANPGFFQDSMIFGPIPGNVAENLAFPDLWQMAYLEGYNYRNC